jgi:hypothetical protein
MDAAATKAMKDKFNHDAKVQEKMIKYDFAVGMKTGLGMAMGMKKEPEKPKAEK